MAPEVHKNDGYGKMSDWWSVGIILYELTFGRNPFNLLNENLSIEKYKEFQRDLEPMFPS